MHKYSIRVFIRSGLVQELEFQQPANTSNHGAANLGRLDAFPGEAAVCLLWFTLPRLFFSPEQHCCWLMQSTLTATLVHQTDAVLAACIACYLIFAKLAGMHNCPLPRSLTFFCLLLAAGIHKV